jgi:hypothetical protein
VGQGRGKRVGERLVEWDREADVAESDGVHQMWAIPDYNVWGGQSCLRADLQVGLSSQRQADP